MATTDARTVKTLYAEAMALMQKGQDEAAIGAFASIIEKNANLAEVHFQVARLFLRNDRLDQALTHIRAAATLKPGVADIWTVYGEVVRTVSDRGVQTAYRTALKAAPLGKREKGALSAGVEFTGKSRVSLGRTTRPTFDDMVRALARGDAGEAGALAEAELRKSGETAAVLTVLATAQLNQGREAEAERSILNALARDPGYAEAHGTYARILKVSGRIEEGLHRCNQALRLAPGMPLAIRLRGQCYKALGLAPLAVEDFERLIALEPGNAENHTLLARAYFDEKRYPEAAGIARKALRKGLKVFPLHSVLANALTEMGRPEEALAELEAGMRLVSNPGGALARIAEIKQTLGRFDEAEAEFLQAIAQEPARGEIYRVYLMAKTIDAEDPLIGTMQAHFADPAVHAYQRAHFGFALAKVMEDLKRHDAVFDYLDPANALMREAYPYDIAKRITHTDRLIASCRTVDWTAAPPASTNCFAPIFVTGMPRSGTTLVEQIIASHSSVTGAGEVGVAPGRALSVLGREGGTYRDARDVAPEALQAVGDGFETYMRELFPGAGRMTDKSIQTFAYIGLLKRAMPHAKFVVVRRDPRDNLLSIYKNVFPEGTHLYAYDVNDLAEYYRQFLRILDFWREVAPDWFYEIHYEKLVADPETEAPKLIAACGLDWEDGCLDFHKTERRVKTLSVYQVRQPMYKSSTRAWERYGDAIRPLLDALGTEAADAAE